MAHPPTSASRVALPSASSNSTTPHLQPAASQRHAPLLQPAGQRGSATPRAPSLTTTTPPSIKCPICNSNSAPIVQMPMRPSGDMRPMTPKTGHASSCVYSFQGVHVHVHDVRTCMTCAWRARGVCMACAWRAHGVRMACAWRAHGVCRGCRGCMACVWRACMCILCILCTLCTLCALYMAPTLRLPLPGISSLLKRGASCDCPMNGRRHSPSPCHAPVLCDIPTPRHGPYSEPYRPSSPCHTPLPCHAPSPCCTSCRLLA